MSYLLISIPSVALHLREAGLRCPFRIAVGRAEMVAVAGLPRHSRNA